MTYILAVGTNLGDKKANIKTAIESLNNIPGTVVEKVSSVYQTEPVGYAEQDDFYNAVMVVNSKFNPNEMLGVCMGIECAMGRIRGIKNGPRIIDLDIIFAQNLKIDTPNLTVPHPRYNERRFVLQPLLELYPSGDVFGINFKQYIDSITGQAIKIIL